MRVQEKLFAEGYSWRSGNVVKFTQENYIESDDQDMKLMWDNTASNDYTQTDPHKFLNETLITEPIDYTGCHPVIAKCLQDNLAVMCNDGEYDCMVYGYSKDSFCPYLGVEVNLNKTAKPVYKKTTKTYVKKASEIIAWLEVNATQDANGWCGNNGRNRFEFSFEYIFRIAGQMFNGNKNIDKEWLEER